MEEIIAAIKASFALDASVFVLLATLGYVLGFLFKNQLILRMLVLISTVLYIIYYYAYPDQPLWAAIFGSLLIICANIIGTLLLIYDQLPIQIDPGHMPIYNSLKGVKPGEFRRLLRTAHNKTTPTAMVLTYEDKPPTHLYYLLNGSGVAEKQGQSFTIPQGRFIGEISFILGGNATATVEVNAGSSVLSWEKSALYKLLEDHPNLKRAFEASIARDMASKLAVSHSINSDKTAGLK